MNSTQTLILLLLTCLLVQSCGVRPVQYNDTVPEHQTFNIESKILNETRVINIWLPPQYNGSKDMLPVVYMPDGGIVAEDFPHIANTLSELVTAGKIAPVILVGIQNSNRKYDLTGPTQVVKDTEWIPKNGGAALFREFIKSELFPEINSRYRVNGHKTIIGESLAGLFVAESFFLAPEMFDNYIAMDPSLWWNDRFLVKNATKLMSEHNYSGKRFWFAGSSAKDIQSATDQLSKLLGSSVHDGLKWKYSPEPKEKHNTVFRATKQKAFIWTFNS